MQSWNVEWSKAIANLEAAIDLLASAKSVAVSDMVLNLYSNQMNPREYHNDNHILSGCALLDRYEAEAGHPLMPPVRYSWMLHDAKNDPRATDNEECSAFLACTIVDDQMPYDCIMSTKLGYEGSSTAGRIIKDIDYSYFGLPYEEYVHTVDLIRQEYKHLSDEEFALGRKMFLSSLDPEKIFWTPFFQKLYAEQAKKNIEQALK